MFRIKKLDIFISRQFGLLFAGTFFICQFVLMMQFLWRYIDMLIGKGLSLEVLAQFFWYMGLMLVPQALPLAILLSSLITFGNLGESCELTAIKAAGISLMQSFRSLIFITLIVALGSFYFQNNIGPTANFKITQLLISMKQKSPELEIPEGVFYDGIPNCNLYVQKKNMDTGMLYGIMIYRMTQSYEDAAIILADSALLQSTAEKKHLVLTLWNGEWFENMRSQEVVGSSAVPYRRETFVKKRIVLDFDGDFNMADATSLSNNARGKSISQIRADIDSIKHVYDSIGHEFYLDAKQTYLTELNTGKADSLKLGRKAMASKYDVDSMFMKLTDNMKKDALSLAASRVESAMKDLEYKSMVTVEGDKLIRMHEIEAINKFTLALSCLMFFFIGAPLGAIIRKGGLGFPVLISVIVYIVYYILDNMGYRMARGGMWSVWFGKLLSTAVLMPIAIFVTYKANKDSVVFNFDLYRQLFMKVLGLRLKRHVFGKEVIISPPNYEEDYVRMDAINGLLEDYSNKHHLIRMPNYLNVFFRYVHDDEIEKVNKEQESVIDDLSNTRDKMVLHYLNQYPILSAKAHTRFFERKWLNVVAGLIVPLGLVLFARMWMFRLRLYRDLKTIRQTNALMMERIVEMRMKA